MRLVVHDCLDGSPPPPPTPTPPPTHPRRAGMCTRWWRSASVCRI
jgi:hypothetical protein